VKHARRSRLGISLAAAFWMAAILTALPGSATPVLDVVPLIENVSSRLNLSAEQEAQLRPLFEKRKSELVHTQLMLQQAVSSEQKRDAMRDAKQQADAFNMQVESLLTPTQKSTWREIRAEVREKAKERAEEKRSQ
jgi:hypothetical protein